MRDTQCPEFGRCREGRLRDNPSLRVIPRSPSADGRRGISQWAESTQSEIPLRPLTDRNDSVGKVIMQAHRETPTCVILLAFS